MKATIRYYYFDVSTVAGEAKYAKLCDDIRNALGLKKPIHYETRERFDHKLETATYNLLGTDDTGTVLHTVGVLPTARKEIYLWAEWFTRNKNTRKGYYLESKHE